MITEDIIDQAALAFADNNWKSRTDVSNYISLESGFNAGAKWVLEQQRWMPVTETLPDSPFPAVLGTDGKNSFVVNYTTGRQIEVDIEEGDAEDFGCEEVNEQFFLKAGWYELAEQRGGYYDEVWIDRNITHWQPLPEIPKP